MATLFGRNIGGGFGNALVGALNPGVLLGGLIARRLADMMRLRRQGQNISNATITSAPVAQAAPVKTKPLRPLRPTYAAPTQTNPFLPVEETDQVDAIAPSAPRAVRINQAPIRRNVNQLPARTKEPIRYF